MTWAEEASGVLMGMMWIGEQISNRSLYLEMCLDWAIDSQTRFPSY